jgi:hypothetical protein
MAPTFSTFLIIVQISSVGIKLPAHYFVKCSRPQRKSLFFLGLSALRDIVLADFANSRLDRVLTTLQVDWPIHSGIARQFS